MLGLWIILMFGSGMPGIYIYGIAWLLVLDVADRWYLVRMCQHPVRYGKNLPYLLLGEASWGCKELSSAAIVSELPGIDVRHPITRSYLNIELFCASGHSVVCPAVSSITLRQHQQDSFEFMAACLTAACRCSALGSCYSLCFWCVDAHLLPCWQQPRLVRPGQQCYK